MTRFHELPDGARLAYDDAGKGRPVVLIHGVCMSRRFFERNTEPLAERFRVVSVDLRGHGESPASEGGHTVAQYAQDVKHLLDTLGLEDAVLVGWSMGSFVIWDLVRQFGAAGSQATSTSRRARPTSAKDGWELGIFPLEELFSTLAAAQERLPRGRWTTSSPRCSCTSRPPTIRPSLVAETQRIGANAGTCILLDQSLQDYREFVATYAVPTLLAWGADEKVVAAANGPWLQATQPARRAGRVRAVGPLPDVGGARALQPGRRRLDRRAARRLLQTNTERGSSMPTFHMPASTISKILRSPARLQSMYASRGSRPWRSPSSAIMLRTAVRAPSMRSSAMPIVP